MKPKFKNNRSWEQAQILMQPAFIRVLDNLRKQVEKSNWRSKYEEVTTPFPGYRLILTLGETQVAIDIWDLCFQVCFANYDPDYPSTVHDYTQATYEVEIDTTLIGEDGDVNWELLEVKTKQIVEKIFTQLA